jgi:hypothetical protein
MLSVDGLFLPYAIKDPTGMFVELAREFSFESGVTVDMSTSDEEMEIFLRGEYKPNFFSVVARKEPEEESNRNPDRHAYFAADPSEVDSPGTVYPLTSGKYLKYIKSLQACRNQVTEALDLPEEFFKYVHVHLYEAWDKKTPPKAPKHKKPQDSRDALTPGPLEATLFLHHRTVAPHYTYISDEPTDPPVTADLLNGSLLVIGRIMNSKGSHIFEYPWGCFSGGSGLAITFRGSLPSPEKWCLLPALPVSSLQWMAAVASSKTSGILQSLSCTVCYSLLSKQGSARQCPSGHLLCEECLNRLADRAYGKRRAPTNRELDKVLVRCPTCREYVPRERYHRSLVAEQLTSSLEGPCPLGCGASLPLSKIEEHSRDECPNRLVQCPFCNRDVPMRNLERHVLEDRHEEQALAADTPVSSSWPRGTWKMVPLPPRFGAGRLFVYPGLSEETATLGTEEFSAYKIRFKTWGAVELEGHAQIEVRLKTSDGRHQTSVCLCQLGGTDASSNSDQCLEVLMIWPKASEPRLMSVWVYLD